MKENFETVSRFDHTHTEDAPPLFHRKQGQVGVGCSRLDSLSNCNAHSAEIFSKAKETVQRSEGFDSGTSQRMCVVPPFHVQKKRNTTMIIQTCKAIM